MRESVRALFQVTRGLSLAQQNEGFDAETAFAQAERIRDLCLAGEALAERIKSRAIAADPKAVTNRDEKALEEWYKLLAPENGLGPGEEVLELEERTDDRDTQDQVGA